MSEVKEMKPIRHIPTGLCKEKPIFFLKKFCRRSQIRPEIELIPFLTERMKCWTYERFKRRGDRVRLNVAEIHIWSWFFGQTGSLSVTRVKSSSWCFTVLLVSQNQWCITGQSGQISINIVKIWILTTSHHQRSAGDTLRDDYLMGPLDTTGKS